MPAGRIRPKHFPEGTLLSFVALAINIITTIVGVASEDSLARKLVFYLLLAVCLVMFISYLFAKYIFLCCTWNIKPSCANTCSDWGLLEDKVGKFCYCLGSCCSRSMWYDLAFCTMVLFYLTGDNLQQNVCEDNCGPCPTIGQVFTAASLILRIFLALLNAGDLKPKLPSTFPVIGKMGNVYSKLLQIATAALTIDLTFTAILESLDIQKAKCNTMDDADTVKQEAIGVMTALCILVLLLMLVVMGLIACDNSVFCDCKGKKVNRWEVCGQWLCVFCVLSFVLLFIVGDVDWFWNFFSDKADTAVLALPIPKIIRLVVLCFSFLALVILMLVYIFVMCLPGLSVALREENFFLSQKANNGLTVVQHMVQKQYNGWDAEGLAKVTQGDCEGKFTVKNEFDKASITLHVNEEMTCCTELNQLYKRFMQWEPMEGDADDQVDWTVQAYIGKGKPNEIKVGKVQKEDSGGATGPSSNDEGKGKKSSLAERNVIEMKPRGKESSIHDASGPVPKFSAVSGRVS